MHHPSDQTEKETKAIIKSKTKSIIIAKNLQRDFLCCFTCWNTWEYPKHILVSMRVSLEASQVHDRYALNLDYFPIKDTADCQTPLSLI